MTPDDFAREAAESLARWYWVDPGRVAAHILPFFAQARREALEEAAKVCDSKTNGCWFASSGNDTLLAAGVYGDQLAAAIRALAQKETTDG